MCRVNNEAFIVSPSFQFHYLPEIQARTTLAKRKTPKTLKITGAESEILLFGVVSLDSLLKCGVYLHCFLYPGRILWRLSAQIKARKLFLFLHPYHTSCPRYTNVSFVRIFFISLCLNFRRQSIVPPLLRGVL